MVDSDETMVELIVGFDGDEDTHLPYLLEVEEVIEKVTMTIRLKGERQQMTEMMIFLLMCICLPVFAPSTLIRGPEMMMSLGNLVGSC